MNQREIKFRVWDNVDYMSKPFTLYDLMGSQAKIEFTHDCIVMQYTGLNDKDGQEIYEGDVVENHYPEKTSDIYIVRFSLSDFGTRFEIVNHATGVNRWWKEATCRVIGNIYQNPELLQQ